DDDPSGLVAALDAANAEVAGAQRRFLELVRRAGASELWRADGARDLAHWLAMRYGISTWKARRWIGAADALGALPAVDDAFTAGELSLDKTVELARFATPEHDARLVRWAREVSVASVRRRADREVAPEPGETIEAERARRLEWWWIDEGRRLGLAGELPAAAGAVVVRALERAAERIGPMPGEDGPAWADARRADALVAVCSAAVGTDPDPDRATVVLHARVDETGMLAGAELEGATAVARSVAERLVCDARVQVLAEDAGGAVMGAGPTQRHPAPWVTRQLRYRDRGCRFPGCGTNAFTQAHHVRWFSRGGTSDLANLVLVCSFHHRLVHEHGWAIRLHGSEVTWITPDGERYRAGPRAPATA
ncbi:MAG TPA: DUF222 domain-containing protein, partial [Actinomycetota bacterium]|nr:DUF222 domain-containing protein [Actinomycetota bacterium]